MNTARPIPPIRYDPSGAFDASGRVTRASFQQLADRIARARDEVKNDVSLFNSSEQVPSDKIPLDAGFVELPQHLLDEYHQDRSQSELGRLLAVAERLRESVDQVVLLGIGGSYMGARALMEACCDPYHNELTRAQRGSRPRLYFAGNNLDNDAVQALLRLLGDGRPFQSVDDRWALLVVSKSGGTIETAVAFRQFYDALRRSCGGEGRTTAELVVPVTGREGRLFELAGAIGCPQLFHVPEGVGGRFSVLSAVGLLPAAVLGLDIVKLLEGAVALNENFLTAPPGENVVLDYVGVGHLWERQGASVRVLSVWSDALEAMGLWYDQLLAESLGKEGIGATPLTTVNTRDLHSRGQQHQEGRPDRLITNLIVESWRSDLLGVRESGHDQDQLNDLAGKTYAELMRAAIAGTNEAYQQVDRPTADLVLPRADEGSLGQLLQMLMLATVVEGRLIGINPYGQPGVEAYKRNMARLLGRG